MSKKNALGDTEKTVLVGVLVLGFWLGIDAIAKRAERKGTTEGEGEGEEPTTTASRRARVVRARRRGRGGRMTVFSDGPTTGSRVKDLVVTAAVASVVSALVAPWVRRWMDAKGLAAALPPPASPGSEAPVPDDFNERLERLLDVPDPFSQRAATAASPRPATSTRTTDGQDNDIPDR